MLGQRAQAGQHLTTVAIGQVHVDERRIKRLPGQCPQRRLDVRRADRPLPQPLQEALHHHAVDLVVLHHQHPVPGGERSRHRSDLGGLGGRGPGRHCGHPDRRRERQRKAHRRPLPRRAHQRDLAAHRPHQTPAHRQPQPGARVVAAVVAHLYEGLEHFRLPCRVDTDTVILDLEAHAPGLRAGTDADGHRPLVAELDRIPHQVEQDLAQLAPIAQHLLRQRRVDVCHQRQPARRCARALHREHIIDRIAQAEGERIQMHAAGLDAGEVEHVFEQLEQQRGRGAHLRQILRALGGRGRALEQLDQAEDARHRRAQLVAHRAQEGGLGVVGLLGGDARAGVLGHLVGERAVGLAQLGGAGQHLVLEFLLVLAQRRCEAVALDGVVAEALERPRQRGQRIVAGRVDVHVALPGRQRQSGTLEREQPAQCVPPQHLHAHTGRDQQQHRRDDAEGDQPRGGTGLGCRARRREDAAAAVNQLACERIERSGEDAHLVLQALAARTQVDLAAAQRKCTLVGQRSGEHAVKALALRAHHRVGDVAQAALEHDQLAVELGTRSGEALGRVDLVEPLAQEGERMHGERELVHALERVEIEVEQAVTRRGAVLRCEGAGRVVGLGLEQAGERRHQQRSGVLRMHARELVERVDGLAQAAGYALARRAQREPCADGVTHRIEPHREGLAGGLQARAQFGLDMGRLERGEAFADAPRFVLEHRAQLLQLGDRIHPRQPRRQRGQAGVAAHHLVQRIGRGQGLAHDGLLAAHHALEAEPADHRDQHRSQRAEEQCQHQALAQAEAAALGFHVRLGAHGS